MLGNKQYKYGFVTQVEAETFKKGLNEGIIGQISEKKAEPGWLREKRLQAYRHWLTLKEPQWAGLKYPALDYQGMHYYSSPKKNTENAPKSLNEVDPELLKTFDRLGISLKEQKRLAGVAVDAVFDSVSLGTTHQDVLSRHGVIFCSFSEAVRQYPDLVKKHFGTVVPYRDNFFACLNAAVFTDGSFAYIPKGVRCPLDLSTYFRINEKETGQFERTLVVAEEGAFVNYLEGCTAPMRDSHQLHAAVVELVAFEKAQIHYSTVQNWYPGDEKGRGGIYNFVTKRGRCAGPHSRISWTQVEAGSAITWKYPSCILQGDYSSGAFYSVALTQNKMQADTGTKMIHIGKHTKSTIISKGISADESVNSYRGQVKIMASARGARNFSQCDSLLAGKHSTANTYPVMEVNHPESTIEHEATTSRINEEQLFYLKAKGLSVEEAVSILVNGFGHKVFKQLPLEFSVEAVKLIEMKLENSIA